MNDLIKRALRWCVAHHHIVHLAACGVLSTIFGAGAGVAAGVAAEIKDESWGGKWGWDDITYDAAGIIIGTAIRAAIAAACKVPLDFWTLL